MRRRIGSKDFSLAVHTITTLRYGLHLMLLSRVIGPRLVLFIPALQLGARPLAATAASPNNKCLPLQSPASSNVTGRCRGNAPWALHCGQPQTPEPSPLAISIRGQCHSEQQGGGWTAAPRCDPQACAPINFPRGEHEVRGEQTLVYLSTLLQRHSVSDSVHHYRHIRQVQRGPSSTYAMQGIRLHIVKVRRLSCATARSPSQLSINEWLQQQHGSPLGAHRSLHLAKHR